MPSLCSALQSFTQRSLGAGSNHRLAPCTLSCCRHSVKGVTRPPSYAPTTALFSPRVLLVRNRSSSTPTFVFSQSDAIAKLNFQVDGEGETPQKCQNRRSHRRRRRRFPAALCHVPWNEGLYDEWWGRAVGFRGRTTVAERRDQSMIVTEAWD